MPNTGQKPQELIFTTRDGLRIAADFYPAYPTLKKGRGFDGTQGLSPVKALGKRGFKKTLVVFSPGFAKYKDAPPMGEICRFLTRYGDVLCPDFRGTGRSEGRYGCGAYEHFDLEAVLKGTPGYRKRILIGLSLGSYISLRTAYEFPKLVDRLLLVSVPTNFEGIIKTWGPLRQGWAIATHWESLWQRLHSVHSIFFRWDYPFRPKPDASKMVRRLKIPISFLAGGKDRLVVKSLTRKVYEKASTPKSWTEIPEGNHAEFMYMENKKSFKAWLRRSIVGNWDY